MKGKRNTVIRWTWESTMTKTPYLNRKKAKGGRGQIYLEDIKKDSAVKLELDIDVKE